MSMFPDDLLSNPFLLLALAISIATIAFGGYFLALHTKLFLLGLKNLRRSPLRTILTSLATMVLVFMVTVIWTVVFALEQMTHEKARDLKIIVTERWAVPSQLPITHANYLNPASPYWLPELQGLYGPHDFMTWSFYGGTMDPAKRDPKDLIFFFAMDPDAIIPMMDDLADFDPALVEKMKRTPNGCLLGKEKMAVVDKRVGGRFTLSSINYKDIDLEFEIVGELPDGRYNQSAIMNMDYFNTAFDKYARAHNGVRHPLDGKRLNLIWIRVADREQFDRIGSIIENARVFADRPIKCETASSGIGAFLDAYRDLLWGMKWLLVPAILVIMALVMANAISITVRERRTEMAVMKVLGYRPGQILQLVLGEALLVGALSGFGAAFLTYALINWKFGGIPFRIAFFPVFRIPEMAMLWGLAIGAGTAFLGSVLPAWTARSVKVSEVFARVA
jgi:putative ABC transport system permease protein